MSPTELLCINLYSRLLYNITREDPSHPSEVIVKQWIKRLNDSLRCSLRYSCSLASTLVQRANNLKWRIKNKGGRQRDSILSQNWTLHTDIDTVAPPTQSGDMVSLTRQVKSLQSQVQASTRVLQKIQETPTRRKRTAKHFSTRHERRRKKQRVDECAAALSWLEDEGFSPVSVTLMNNDTHELTRVTIREDIENALGLQSGEELTEKDADIVSMMLYIKDRYNISGSAYHELASLCHQMPRHYRLKDRISELNSKWRIVPTPEGTVCVQQSFEERLRTCLERMVSSITVVSLMGASTLKLGNYGRGAYHV